VTLGNIIALVALAVPVVGIGYNYTYTLWPRFLKAEAETNYARCLRECHEVCQANGVPITPVPGDPRICKCDNCLKYLQGE
jgi:hypothetical protein